MRKNQLARCEPGVVVADLQAVAAEKDLFYPPDPSSKKFCTLGGNVSCNAGGLRCVNMVLPETMFFPLEAT